MTAPPLSFLDVCPHGSVMLGSDVATRRPFFILVMQTGTPTTTGSSATALPQLRPSPLDRLDHQPGMRRGCIQARNAGRHVHVSGAVNARCVAVGGAVERHVRVVAPADEVPDRADETRLTLRAAPAVRAERLAMVADAHGSPVGMT
jgi:hypothetical protein